MDWQTLRNQFMRDIGGDPPGAQLEDELIAAYHDHPEAVERSIEKITLAHKAGKIRSPWGALKTEVAKALDAARNPTHNTGASRNKAIARAEQWLRTAGLHYDRETEIHDELFGDRGILRDHHTPQVEERLTALWRELRPLGEQVEREAEERGARYVEQRERLRKALADPKTKAKAQAA
jgi:hypothetical protein